MAQDKQERKPQVLGFVGVGLDSADGHHRITRTENFFLVGGSDQTHGQLQDTAVRFNESLRRKGKRLQDTPPEEALDLLHEAIDP